MSSRITAPAERLVANNVATSEALDADRLPQQGDVPERYRLRAELGRGAKSVVFEAFDSALCRNVAIKVIDKLAMDPPTLVRFQNEAKITSVSIILTLFVSWISVSIRTVSHSWFSSMLLGSRCVSSSMRAARSTMDNDTAFEMFKGVGSALAHANSHDVYHRDLKPENLIVHGESPETVTAKLIDFGLAKFVQTEDTIVLKGGTTLIGTPAYMSPGLVNGRSYDVRSEIYSFGCVLFEALTGRPVFSVLWMCKVSESIT